MHRRRFLAWGGAALAGGLAAPGLIRAQAPFPNRAIRLVVPFSAGGVVDIVARLWADQVKTGLGAVFVENMGGAGGTIGAGDVARAPADGHTILLGNTSTQILNPAIMEKPLYDPATSFQTISILASSAVAIAVAAHVPARTLEELAAHIKAHPNKLSYGSPGTGTFTHLAGEMFKQATNITDLIHVPYNGAGPGISNLVSGHIPIMVLNITNQVIELHRAEKLRIVSVLTPKRLDVMPEVAAAVETLPDLVAMLFVGLFVPKATPPAIVERVAKANRESMSTPEVKAKLTAAGFDPVVDTPALAQAFVDAERKRLVSLVQRIGFKVGA